MDTTTTQTHGSREAAQSTHLANIQPVPYVCRLSELGSVCLTKLLSYICTNSNWITDIRSGSQGRPPTSGTPCSANLVLLCRVVVWNMYVCTYARCVREPILSPFPTPRKHRTVTWRLPSPCPFKWAAIRVNTDMRYLLAERLGACGELFPYQYSNSDRV